MNKKLFHSRKGEDSNTMVLMAVIGLVVGIGISYIFIDIAKSYATGEIYDLIYSARDMALLIDSLYAVPGDVYLEYKEELGNNIITIKDNYVNVNPGSNLEIKYSYVSDKQHLDEYLSPSDNLYLIKQGYDIKYSNSEVIINSILCSDENLLIKNILIDISGNQNDEIMSSVGEIMKISESEYLSSVANSIKNSLSSKNINVKIVDTNNGYSKDNILSEISLFDYFIVLRSDFKNSNLDNKIISYTHDNFNSRNLGCHIVSQLVKLNMFSESSMKVSDLVSDDVFRYSQINELYSLNDETKNDKIIYLSIGNLKSDNSINPYFRTTEIGESIGRGIVFVVS